MYIFGCLTIYLKLIWLVISLAEIWLSAAVICQFEVEDFDEVIRLKIASSVSLKDVFLGSLIENTSLNRQVVLRNAEGLFLSFMGVSRLLFFEFNYLVFYLSLVSLSRDSTL